MEADLTRLLTAQEAAIQDAAQHLERANVEISRRERAEIAFTLSEQKRLALIDRAEALEFQLTALRQERSWQPIETAPKDRPILLSGPESIDIGYWMAEQPDVLESGVVVECGMDAGWFGNGGMWPGDEQPTHWMPLPPALTGTGEAP